MRHTFTSDQFLPCPIELVFAFFANPENLPRLMPSWQKARIEEAAFAPPPPHSSPDTRYPGIAAGAGTRMTISFRPFPFSPIRIPWEAEITEFTWNAGFCDTQLRGPFAFWRHCHTLTPGTRDNVSGTLLHDAVEYEMHMGSLGELANLFVVGHQLRSTFNYRHKRTEDLLPLMRRR